MKRPRLVLDTNVVLSAILWGGNPAEYFALAAAGVIEIFISPFLFEELSRILKKKFRWSNAEISRVCQWYSSMTTLVEPSRHLTVIRRKEDDNRVLECALEARVDYLVTGDKTDLLPLKHFRGIRIVSPIEGLALLSSSLHA